MKTIKGPGIFLAQFAGDAAPFNNLKNICRYMADLGYKAVQIPSWDGRMIDLQKAAESKTYADEIKGIVAETGMEISELSTHLQGQLVAVHPAYNELFDGFAPANLKGDLKGKSAWATKQLKYAAKASANLGLNAHATLLWCLDVAHGLSVATASCRIGGNRLYRTRQPMDAYFECL